MNDWITHYFAAFWIVCIVVGGITGAVALGFPWGLFAGLLGGAGAALILSVNRYIGGDDTEDDGPRG